jgi:dipeptidyl aminopeptidase/acylaminoacyl peptidase
VSLADADGGNVRVLIGNQSGPIVVAPFSRALWSPDGTSLLVNYGTAHNQFLEILSTIHPNETLGEVEYDPQCYPVQALRAPAPSWSPDGRHFVVNGWSDTVDAYEVPMICILSAAGEFERALARGDYPAWSPDGSRIAFEAAQMSDSSIHTIAPDGTDERDLSPSPSAGPRERFPAWSPDGGELSFLVHSPDETDIFIYELWVMDALGGNRRRLVPQVGSSGTWSRDGARLAFRLPSGQLAVIKRDGTGLTPVSPIGGEVSSWSWRP